MELGKNFEREIREQPEVWERLARTDAALRLARAIAGDVLLVGSGSSLFAAQVGALALRRRGIDAHAVAATEAQNDNNAYHDRVVIAVSQSGHSADLLSALDALHPRTLIALTNTVASPLGERADVTIDVAAGVESAIPASKSVTSTIAILLWAASLIAGDEKRNAHALRGVAQAIRAWLNDSGVDAVVEAAKSIAQRPAIVVLGTDYGAPIAREVALKFKEATYLHAEGFAAGEFRHGSSAIVDAHSAVIGIMDRDAIEVVGRPLREAAASGALRYAIGTTTIDGVPRLGPLLADPYNALAWLVTAQLLALHVARVLGVDSDVPRGLRKAMTE
ncbi:MAG TPA: SIS domain-containing protein [Candidatus Baltobacteraceae bacterium]|nr:SIS domain-containing protein [Candidatus Baltobacteraceae bacterium]